jgi:hypothetical protein
LWLKATASRADSLSAPAAKSMLAKFGEKESKPSAAKARKSHPKARAHL